MFTVRRVLVVSRATKHCRKALQFGTSMAKAFGAELHVMHVVHSPLRFAFKNIPSVFCRALDKECGKMTQHSQEELDRLTRSGRNIKVVRGEPREEIFKFIEDQGIDVLVMSAHEKWRPEQILYGKETEEILRKMPCSIFLVQQHQPIDELGA